MLMYFLLLFIFILLVVIYFKLIIPYYYWYQRKIYFITPWGRLMKVFFSKNSFSETTKQIYDDHPNRRYFGSYQFLRPALFIRDLDLIKKITIKDFDYFPDHVNFSNEKTAPIMSKNLFSLKGQKWKQMRSTLSPAFTSSKMRQMFNLMCKNADNFVDYFQNEINQTSNNDGDDNTLILEMRDTFSKFTNDVIANCAFGLECDSLRNKKNEFFEMGNIITNSSFLTLMRSLLMALFPFIFDIIRRPSITPRLMMFFKNLIVDTIKMREENHIIRPDMIHLLMEARKGRLKNETNENNGGNVDAGFATVQESDLSKTTHQKLEITDDVITAQAVVFFIAGFSTISSLMSFMCYELALNPDIQMKLQREIDDYFIQTNGEVIYEEILKLKYLDQVISETLRKWPPAFSLNRICEKNYEIPSNQDDELTFIVEKGCLITIPVIGIHMDKKYFPNPDRFDPERFNDENKSTIIPGSYMPFGVGPRNCIGSRFALLEVKALMVKFLSKFDVIVVGKTQIPIRLAKSITIEAKNGMWLGIKRRML